MDLIIGILIGVLGVGASSCVVRTLLKRREEEAFSFEEEDGR